MRESQVTAAVFAQYFRKERVSFRALAQSDHPEAISTLERGRNMKKPMALACIACLVLLTCSKKPTEPGDDNPPPQPTFTIKYTADESRAVEQRIVADAGGSLSAEDMSGVSFELTIPPHALKADTIIRIIPLLSLSIAGPGGTGCDACAAADSLCCFRGALFEPAGTVLDSAATLTIRFPAGALLPFAKRPLIAYIDADENRYEPIYTECDSAAGTLSARVIHFSGYGTDDDGYDRLEAEVYETAEELTKDIGKSGFYVHLYPMDMLHDLCRFPIVRMGETIVYPELAATIEGIMLDAYQKHAAAIQGQAFNVSPCDGLWILRECIENLANFVAADDIITHGWTNHDAFASIKSATEGDFDALFRRTARDGKSKCDHDKCVDGKELLDCALRYIERDDRISTDPNLQSLIDTVANWEIACCKVNITLEAEKTTLYSLAVSSSDDSNYVKFTATTTDPFGPFEGATVRIEGTHDRTGQTIYPSAVNTKTDDNGKAYATFVWDQEASIPPGTSTWKAAFQYWSDEADSMVWVWSEPVTITLKPVTFNVSYRYSYTYDATSACGSTSVSGLATSEDLLVLGASDICQLRAKVARAYSYQSSCVDANQSYSRTESLLEPINIPPCYWGYYTEEHSNPDGWRYRVLKHVTVNWLSPAYIHVKTVSEYNGAVTVDSLWMDMWGIRPALGDPAYTYFNYPGRTATWDTTYGTSTTTMRISVIISR
jgi:hypothetical protein